MNQEAMRAIVLIAQHIRSVDGLNAVELEELAFLELILRRSSRAQEAMELEDLEARATGKPMPERERQGSRAAEILARGPR